MVDGELVIHNKKLEEWIPVEQEINQYIISWNQNNDFDSVTPE